jgi:hypothetical protein
MEINILNKLIIYFISEYGGVEIKFWTIPKLA